MYAELGRLWIDLSIAGETFVRSRRKATTKIPERVNTFERIQNFHFAEYSTNSPVVRHTNFPLEKVPSGYMVNCGEYESSPNVVKRSGKLALKEVLRPKYN